MLAGPCRREEKKMKILEFDDFLVFFNMFLTCKSTCLRSNSRACRKRERKKEAELSVFFLVRPDCSTSEDSSTIEYNAGALSFGYSLPAFYHLTKK